MEGYIIRLKDSTVRYALRFVSCLYTGNFIDNKCDHIKLGKTTNKNAHRLNFVTITTILKI
jgi:hypothetical protein